MSTLMSKDLNIGQILILILFYLYSLILLFICTKWGHQLACMHRQEENQASVLAVTTIRK